MRSAFCGRCSDGLHGVTNIDGVVGWQAKILDSKFMHNGIDLEDGGLDTVSDQSCRCGANPQPNIQGPFVRVGRLRLYQSDSLEHGEDRVDGFANDAWGFAWGDGQLPLSSQQAVVASHDTEALGVVFEHREIPSDRLAPLEERVVVEGQGVVHDVGGAVEKTMGVDQQGESDGGESHPDTSMRDDHSVQSGQNQVQANAGPEKSWSAEGRDDAGGCALKNRHQGKQADGGANLLIPVVVATTQLTVVVQGCRGRGHNKGIASQDLGEDRTEWVAEV